MTNYCISCGYATATAYIVCADCSELNSVPECFVPITCGDELCYVTANGDINLDGECEHADAIHSLFTQQY